MPTKGMLKGRWTDALVESVLAELRAGATPEPFGSTEDGMRDLRGLQIRGILRNLRMSNIDFGFCRSERGGQFLGCNLTRVNFSGSSLKTNIDGTFVSCVFDRSNLAGCLFRGQFRDCSFRRATMKGAAGESVRFRECSFNDADLRGAHLCACTFEQCTWRSTLFGDGSLYRSKFLGDSPKELGNTLVDLSTLS